MQPVGVWKSLRDDTIYATLKFGFQQKPWKYTVADASNAIMDKLYRDAELWLYELARTYRTGQLNERYTIHLFRIPSTEMTLVPIIQPSDIEQNSIIEIVLVPIETNQNPHSLYRCQLNVPTNCSKCTRFIAGLYRQGYRCRNCRLTYHKDCAPLLQDDCLVQKHADLPAGRRTSSSSTSQLTLNNPFVTEQTQTLDRTNSSQKIHEPVYKISTNTSENAETIAPNKIIDRGIFPACIRGNHFYRRYLFRLTKTVLSVTTNLSTDSVSQQYLTQTGESETIFPLIEIEDLRLTHFEDDRDGIFEIHLRNKTVLSVGKKTDSQDLQMDVAQFYSTVRDQQQTLINANLPSSLPQPTNPSTVPGSPRTNLDPKVLMRKSSTFRVLPLEKDGQQKDLYELYEFTGEKIGEGAFGRVVGALNKTTGHEVAMKIMEKANCGEQDILRIKGEINNLYKFGHVNILKLEAYFEFDDAVYLATERMETDLCKYINDKEAGYLEESITKMIAFQLIAAVRYLHGNNCGHLDIKCENILISLLKPKGAKKGDVCNPEYPLVKLADFGYSRIIGEHSFRKTRVGTKVYNAPEIYRGPQGYNRLADMWSIGIVLYAGLSGTLPYDEKGSQRAEEIVRDKKNLFSGSRWKQVSSDAKNLIADKLLVAQASSRMTSSDAIFHDWFNDVQLYGNLREIEKRTKVSVQEKQQELPSSATWLTGEREDLLWTECRDIYLRSRQQKT